MDPRVVSLIRLLAEKESGEEVVTTFLGGGRQESETRQHAEVLELRPEEGIVELRHGDSLARLHFDEAEMLALLAGVAKDGEDVWGYPMSEEEAAARFLTIYVDESLATREPHESGWWTYRACFFHPIPPWEAHAQRHQGS